MTNKMNINSEINSKTNNLNLHKLVSKTLNNFLLQKITQSPCLHLLRKLITSLILVKQVCFLQFAFKSFGYYLPGHRTFEHT